MLEILLAQRSRKPRSQVQDYLKTIYQSEFGSGHMVEDAAESLERLQKELAGCGRAEEAFEQIGGGLARLNLGAIEELGLRAQTVNALFVEASNLSRGSDAGLEEKLEALRQGAAALGLDAAQVEREIESWRARGYPAPSHSQEYRRAYAPAYRLVPEAARRFVRLFAAIDALLAREGRARVAIDGNCAAGKSTLGALLARVYAGNLYHMDDFFLPPERKTAARLAEPGGNVDRERFAQEVLANLGTAFSYRPWSCRTGTLQAAVRVQPRAVEIVEGAYSVHPDLAGAYDVRVFLGIGARAQRERIVRRDGEAMLRRFIQEWIPLENLYFERLRVRQRCELVFEVA